MEPNFENPIDFNLLHGLTGGNAQLEQELLKIFLESADECLAGLRLSLAQDEAAGWKQHAHAFKGICLNLGANNLGILCRQAQEDYRAPQDNKRTLLHAIETEMERVVSEINKVVSG